MFNPSLLDCAAAKAAPRRFTGELPSAFAPLREADSLVARVETIWRMRKSRLQFEFGERNLDTDVYQPAAIYTLLRAEAAEELRMLRKIGCYLHKTDVGYYVEMGEPDTRAAQSPSVSPAPCVMVGRE